MTLTNRRVVQWNHANSILFDAMTNHIILFNRSKCSRIGEYRKRAKSTFFRNEFCATNSYSIASYG